MEMQYVLSSNWKLEIVVIVICFPRHWSEVSAMSLLNYPDRQR